MTSTHEVPVISVKLEKHPNADSLSIVRVYGWTVCVRTSDWADGELGAYVQPDMLVDTTRPEFSFLAEPGKPVNYRVKVKKLRQVVSMGLLVKAPPGSSEGEDVAEILGVTRYEPPEPSTRGGGTIHHHPAEPGPPIFTVKYDVEAWRRWKDVLVPGEDVWVSEKIHGANGRWAWHGGRLYCGSRSLWKAQKDRNGEMTDSWWVAAVHAGIVPLLMKHENCVFYGEIFGPTQDLRYDHVPGQPPFLRIFDVLGDGIWWTPSQLADRVNEEWLVPTIYRGPYDPEAVEKMAEGQSLIASNIREGCVIKPTDGRVHDKLGRVCLKLVGNGYYER